MLKELRMMSLCHILMQHIQTRLVALPQAGTFGQYKGLYMFCMVDICILFVLTLLPTHGSIFVNYLYI